MFLMSWFAVIKVYELADPQITPVFDLSLATTLPFWSTRISQNDPDVPSLI